jgi:hypothetical protein
MANANDKQVSGTHYKKNAIQPWDYVAANNLGYFEGSAVKYLTRWKDKGGIADLEKAVHFIEKLIELEKANALHQEQKPIRALVSEYGGRTELRDLKPSERVPHARGAFLSEDE